MTERRNLEVIGQQYAKVPLSKFFWTWPFPVAYLRGGALGFQERGSDHSPVPELLPSRQCERDLQVGECASHQGARCRPTDASRYVDEHRGRFGVEPICKTLGVSVSAYYQRRSDRRSARAIEDERLLARLPELQAANYYAYGYRRLWKALRRAGEQVPAE